jgi:3-hydroxyacyl-CoA dehydrogenase
MKKRRIKSIAVLGSGTMGSQIAAHCANAGYEVLLLDMKSDDQPNKIADEALKKIQKMNPAPFAKKAFAKRITTGNFEDDLEKIADKDWICEVIVERMDIKQKMMGRIAKHRKKDSVVSTNTSGLPIGEIASGQDDEFRQHFLGTHFFNPPRYMKLLEIIPTEDTSEEVVLSMTDFCERILGKGVVTCKDTPNFIANRIGVFSMASILPYAFDGILRFEDIDVLTGTLTGYSKAATFRTADMVGLDVLAHVANNIVPNIPDDERKEMFDLPEGFSQMVKNGHLGNKSGEGFYKKVKTDKGKEYLVINPETGDYESQETTAFESVAEAKEKYKTSGERLKFLVNQDDEAGNFLWEIHSELFLYAANRVPEIADSIQAIDRAMKWGFNWEMGPFEKWDAVGVEASVERMKSEGKEIPAHVLIMLESGRTSFYDKEAGTLYNLATGEVENLAPPAKGAVMISSLQADKREVISKKDAALYDLGDGVALFEVRSKANTLGREVIETLFESFDKVEAEFDALVIGNEGNNFSVGANLGEIGYMVQKGKLDQVSEAIKAFQQAAVGLRNLPVPVVAAPFNKNLGGGCEFMMHADHVVAHHELYTGLVEIGVGLLPAGGGTKEMLHRAMTAVPEDDTQDPLFYLKETFKTIGMAKVSMSAQEARDYGYLRSSDTILMNKDLLIAQAKKQARVMADAGYVAPPTPKVTLLGKDGYSALKLMLYIMDESKFITPYDKVVGERIAYVLTGGDLSEPQEVPEQYVLDLEREQFIELLKDKRTHARMEHMLKKGKPLRN